MTADDVAIRTRFAPSPTGDLHLGGAYVALASWWLARRAGEHGRFVVRVEDIDPPRVVAGSAERVLDDLRWLGLEWDGDVVWQSQRTAAYEEALAALARQDLLYPCDCSRAEIARVASAPHAGEEVVYPGTCRDKDPTRSMKRDPAVRVRVPRGDESARTVVDEVAGAFAQRLDRDVGDFVLRRGDGVFAYQLAVTVDDLAADVTDVVRGDDLLPSTPRQLWLAERLAPERAGRPSRAWWRTWHVPLVVDASGGRLAKRTRGASVRALREAGIARDEILGALATSLGVFDGARATPEELLAVGAGARLAPREAFRIPERFSAVER